MCAAAFCIPSRLPVLTAMVFACGCGSQPQNAEQARTAPPKFDVNWQEHSVGGVAAETAEPVAIKQGAAPLFYLSELGETLRVVDSTSRQTLAEVNVVPRTILSVDERAGVASGGVTLVPGPLPAGHRYAIYVVPPGANVSRSGRAEPVSR